MTMMAMMMNDDDAKAIMMLSSPMCLAPVLMSLTLLPRWGIVTLMTMMAMMMMMNDDDANDNHDVEFSTVPGPGLDELDFVTTVGTS